MLFHINRTESAASSLGKQWSCIFKKTKEYSTGLTMYNPSSDIWKTKLYNYNPNPNPNLKYNKLKLNNKPFKNLLYLTQI